MKFCYCFAMLFRLVTKLTAIVVTGNKGIMIQTFISSIYFLLHKCNKTEHEQWYLLFKSQQIAANAHFYNDTVISPRFSILLSVRLHVLIRFYTIYGTNMHLQHQVMFMLLTNYYYWLPFVVMYYYLARRHTTLPRLCTFSLRHFMYVVIITSGVIKQ